MTEQTRTEAQYRALRMDSSSSLKEFSMNRKNYYKKYFLNEAVEEEQNKAATTGRLVETMLMEPELFDSKFYLSVCSSAPTGLMLAFVEALYKHTAACTNEDGVVTRTMEEIIQDAYAESGFKIKLEAVLAKFAGSDAEVYYQEIREVRSKGLTVVTTEEISNAEKIVNELKSNFATSTIVNLQSDNNFTVNNQLQIEGYKINGHEFKSMLDKVIVDHKNKTIQVYDLKCTWSVENFYREYYLYRRAYIQAYLYWVAAHTLLEVFPNYRIEFPKFIVCDSINYMNPLVYTLNDEDMDDAYLGFEYKGHQYPGVKELIAELDWAIAENVWNISKKNYENRGLVNIKE
jgi:translation initiation factor 1 (eIF-1/SUI1)